MVVNNNNNNTTTDSYAIHQNDAESEQKKHRKNEKRRSISSNININVNGNDNNANVGTNNANVPNSNSNSSNIESNASPIKSIKKSIRNRFQKIKGVGSNGTTNSSSKHRVAKEDSNSTPKQKQKRHPLNNSLSSKKKKSSKLGNSNSYANKQQHQRKSSVSSTAKKNSSSSKQTQQQPLLKSNGDKNKNKKQLLSSSSSSSQKPPKENTVLVSRTQEQQHRPATTTTTTSTRTSIQNLKKKKKMDKEKIAAAAAAAAANVEKQKQKKRFQSFSESSDYTDTDFDNTHKYGFDDDASSAYLDRGYSLSYGSRGTRSCGSSSDSESSLDDDDDGDSYSSSVGSVTTNNDDRDGVTKRTQRSAMHRNPDRSRRGRRSGRVPPPLSTSKAAVQQVDQEVEHIRSPRRSPRKSSNRFVHEDNDDGDVTNSDDSSYVTGTSIYTTDYTGSEEEDSQSCSSSSGSGSSSDSSSNGGSTTNDEYYTTSCDVDDRRHHRSRHHRHSRRPSTFDESESECWTDNPISTFGSEEEMDRKHKKKRSKNIIYNSINNDINNDMKKNKPLFVLDIAKSDDSDNVNDLEYDESRSLDMTNTEHTYNSREIDPDEYKAFVTEQKAVEEKAELEREQEKIRAVAVAVAEQENKEQQQQQAASPSPMVLSSSTSVFSWIFGGSSVATEPATEPTPPPESARDEEDDDSLRQHMEDIDQDEAAEAPALGRPKSPFAVQMEMEETIPTTKSPTTRTSTLPRPPRSQRSPRSLRYPRSPNQDPVVVCDDNADDSVALRGGGLDSSSTSYIFFQDAIKDRQKRASEVAVNSGCGFHINQILDGGDSIAESYGGLRDGEFILSNHTSTSATTHCQDREEASEGQLSVTMRGSATFSNPDSSNSDNNWKGDDTNGNDNDETTVDSITATNDFTNNTPKEITIVPSSTVLASAIASPSKTGQEREVDEDDTPSVFLYCCLSPNRSIEPSQSQLSLMPMPNNDLGLKKFKRHNISNLLPPLSGVLHKEFERAVAASENENPRYNNANHNSNVVLLSAVAALADEDDADADDATCASTIYTIDDSKNKKNNNNTTTTSEICLRQPSSPLEMQDFPSPSTATYTHRSSSATTIGRNHNNVEFLMIPVNTGEYTHDDDANSSRAEEIEIELGSYSFGYDDMSYSNHVSAGEGGYETTTTKKTIKAEYLEDCDISEIVHGKRGYHKSKTATAAEYSILSSPPQSPSERRERRKNALRAHRDFLYSRSNSRDTNLDVDLDVNTNGKVNILEECAAATDGDLKEWTSTGVVYINESQEEELFSTTPAISGDNSSRLNSILQDDADGPIPTDFEKPDALMELVRNAFTVMISPNVVAVDATIPSPSFPSPCVHNESKDDDPQRQVNDQEAIIRDARGEEGSNSDAPLPLVGPVEDVLDAAYRFFVPKQDASPSLITETTKGQKDILKFTNFNPNPGMRPKAAMEPQDRGEGGCTPAADNTTKEPQNKDDRSTASEESLSSNTNPSDEAILKVSNSKKKLAKQNDTRLFNTEGIPLELRPKKIWRVASSVVMSREAEENVSSTPKAKLSADDSETRICSKSTSAAAQLKSMKDVISQEQQQKGDTTNIGDGIDLIKSSAVENQNDTLETKEKNCPIDTTEQPLEAATTNQSSPAPAPSSQAQPDTKPKPSATPRYRRHSGLRRLKNLRLYQDKVGKKPTSAPTSPTSLSLSGKEQERRRTISISHEQRGSTAPEKQNRDSTVSSPINRRIGLRRFEPTLDVPEPSIGQRRKDTKLSPIVTSGDEADAAESFVASASPSCEAMPSPTKKDGGASPRKSNVSDIRSRIKQRRRSKLYPNRQPMEEGQQQKERRDALSPTRATTSDNTDKSTSKKRISTTKSIKRNVAEKVKITDRRDDSDSSKDGDEFFDAVLSVEDDKYDDGMTKATARVTNVRRVLTPPPSQVKQFLSPPSEHLDFAALSPKTSTLSAVMSLD